MIWLILLFVTIITITIVIVVVLTKNNVKEKISKLTQPDMVLQIDFTTDPVLNAKNLNEAIDKAYLQSNKTVEIKFQDGIYDFGRNGIRFLGKCDREYLTSAGKVNLIISGNEKTVLRSNSTLFVIVGNYVTIQNLEIQIVPTLVLQSLLDKGCVCACCLKDSDNSKTNCVDSTSRFGNNVTCISPKVRCGSNGSRTWDLSNNDCDIYNMAGIVLAGSHNTIQNLKITGPNTSPRQGGVSDYPSQCLAGPSIISHYDIQQNLLIQDLNFKYQTDTGIRYTDKSSFINNSAEIVDNIISKVVSTGFAVGMLFDGGGEVEIFDGKSVSSIYRPCTKDNKPFSVVHNLKILDCEIYNPIMGPCLSLSGVEDAIVLNSIFRDSQFAESTTIDNGCHRIIFMGNTVQRGMAGVGGLGIDCCNDGVIAYNYFDQNAKTPAITIMPHNGISVGTSVTNNVFFNCPSGCIYLRVCGIFKADRCYIGPQDFSQVKILNKITFGTCPDCTESTTIVSGSIKQGCDTHSNRDVSGWCWCLTKDPTTIMVENEPSDIKVSDIKLAPEISYPHHFEIDESIKIADTIKQNLKKQNLVDNLIYN